MAGATYVVAPSGTAYNLGTVDSPISLAHACANGKPGNTFLLRGAQGSFVGDFDQQADGTSLAPIAYESYPGERAVIDGSLTLNGDYVRAEWLEGKQSDWATRGATHATVFEAFGYHSTFRHCLGHQAVANAFGFWAPVKGGDFYGNIALNSGLSTDPLGGHGCYTQNDGTEQKKVRASFFGPNNGWGLHAYTESSGNINNFLFESLVAYGQGAIVSGATGVHPAFLSGTRSRSNHIYRRCRSYADLPGAAISETNGTTKSGLTIEDCDLTADSIVDDDTEWTSVTISGNVVEGSTGISAAVAAGSTVYAAGAGPDRYYVEADEFEDGRAMIVVRNNSGATSQSIDLSAVLDAGDTYAVFDAFNPLAGNVATGTFGGTTITVPMIGLTCEAPLDPSKVTPAHPCPDFGVFVVLKGRTTFVAPAA